MGESEGFRVVQTTAAALQHTDPHYNTLQEATQSCCKEVAPSVQARCVQCFHQKWAYNSWWKKQLKHPGMERTTKAAHAQHCSPLPRQGFNKSLVVVALCFHPQQSGTMWAYLVYHEAIRRRMFQLYDVKQHMTVKKLLVTKLRIKTSCHGCQTMKHCAIHNTGHFMRGFTVCCLLGKGCHSYDDKNDLSGCFKSVAVAGTFKQ